MISGEQADRLRDQLLAVLHEDAHNAQRLAARLDTISQETGVGAYAALLLILTRRAMDDAEARRHWEAIVVHRSRMSKALERDVGIRVAVLDYFLNINQRVTEPSLIDLEIADAGENDEDVDPVTGLSSNRAFHALLQKEVSRARRYETGVAVALFDLDDFARVNHVFGELMCNRLLREAAILLRNTVRDIDFAARPGEDELAVLLPETDRNGALVVAERLRRKAERHFASREVGGCLVQLTLSAGVAAYPQDAVRAEELVEHAAQALYVAKASGKNTVQTYQVERRRYLRFDLAPGRFEVEVLSPEETRSGRVRNLSRAGVLFAGPEPLHVGEELEIRLVTGGDPGIEPSLRIRGKVVRLEELPPGEREGGDGETQPDRFEVGVAFELAAGAREDDLMRLLEKAQSAVRRGV